MKSLLDRHLSLSSAALRDLDSDVALKRSATALPRLVIWPESPMNFSYSRDSQLRDVVATLARTNHTSVLLNSLEPAPHDGSHNSAVLVNQEGRIVAQYDKIRLMPFGEYVPLPRWLPGASSVRGIVGDFTPGSSYTLMPLGDLRAGVFICIEAAHPLIARRFTKDGADVLINISNDGYLGPTPVMRQHLSNAVFRAVENDRPLIRVTNSGISAYIDANGSVWDATPGFTQEVRTWTVAKGKEEWGTKCQKPDRKGGLLPKVALPYGRASDRKVKNDCSINPGIEDFFRGFAQARRTTREVSLMSRRNARN